MTDLSQDALEKAAGAVWREWTGRRWDDVDPVNRELSVAVACAAITAYKDATDPIAFPCLSCHAVLHWPWKEDPPGEVRCSCGAMAPTGWPS